MPVKWFLIILMTAMIVTPISLIIDQGYLDSAGGVSGSGEDSIINMLMGGMQNSKADFNIGTVWTVLTGPNFAKGLWKVVSADYSFFKTQGTEESAQSDSIIWWFRATFMLMNFVIFLAIAISIASALIGAAVK